MPVKPQFTILAGPNGAGKSTYGHIHIPPTTPIFNGDLVFAELVKQYPHNEPEMLGGGVAVPLEKACDKAIAEQADFAFESNFSNDMAAGLTRLFKGEGYETTLIYFGLNSLSISGNRVKSRVELGGHHVPKDIIRFNFEEGIKRVNAHLDDFNKILFVDTSIAGTAPVIAWCNKISLRHNVLNSNIDWFNKHFKDSLEQDFLMYKNTMPDNTRPSEGT